MRCESIMEKQMKRYTVYKHLESLNLECIKNGNISVQHLDRKGLRLYSKGKGRLALNFLNQIWKFWRPVKQFNEPISSYDLSDEVDHKVSGKSESPFLDPIIDRYINDIWGLKQLRNQKPQRIIIGCPYINSIKNKFESQFSILNFFKTFRLDRTAKGGDIPCSYIKQITLNNSFEGFM